MTELVTDYLERRMSFGQRLRFQLHIAMCRHCREYLRQIRTTIRATGVLRLEDVPVAVREELLHRFRAWCGERGSRGPFSESIASLMVGLLSGFSGKQIMIYSLKDDDGAMSLARQLEAIYQRSGWRTVHHLLDVIRGKASGIKVVNLDGKPESPATATTVKVLEAAGLRVSRVGKPGGLTDDQVEIWVLSGTAA